MPKAAKAEQVQAVVARRREVRRKMRAKLETIRKTLQQQDASGGGADGSKTQLNNKKAERMRKEAQLLEQELKINPCARCARGDHAWVYDLGGDREKAQMPKDADSSFEKDEDEEDGDDDEEDMDIDEDDLTNNRKEHAQDAAEEKQGQGSSNEDGEKATRNDKDGKENDEEDKDLEDGDSDQQDEDLEDSGSVKWETEEDEDLEDSDSDQWETEDDDEDNDEMGIMQMLFGLMSVYFQDGSSGKEDDVEYLVGSADSGKKLGLPGFKLRGVSEIWEYGMEDENWYLKDNVKAFKDFYVVDKKTEQHMLKVAKLVDESVDKDNRGLVSLITSINADYLKDVLSWGADPDLMDYSGMRPSMICPIYCNPEHAKAIQVCRPDLAAKDLDDMTPLERAKYWTDGKSWIPFNLTIGWERRLKIVQIWEKTEKEGFPPLARLAYKKRWYAVKNLCRRRVVPQEEKFAVHEGKTAIEWALHYGKERLAQEMRYLLGEPIVEEKKPSGAEGVQVDTTACAGRASAVAGSRKRKLTKE